MDGAEDIGYVTTGDKAGFRGEEGFESREGEARVSTGRWGTPPLDSDTDAFGERDPGGDASFVAQRRDDHFGIGIKIRA